MKTESQNKRIYKWLKAGNKINPLLALNKFGCLRLAARIFDIQTDMLEKDETIQRKMIYIGNQKEYTEYQLIK